MRMNMASFRDVFFALRCLLQADSLGSSTISENMPGINSTDVFSTGAFLGDGFIHLFQKDTDFVRQLCTILINCFTLGKSIFVRL